MIDPLSTNERDAVGAADRLVVGIGAALAATVPTLFVVLVRPERLNGPIRTPSAKGRQGPILGAGLFFVLAMILLSLIAYAANPEAGGIAIKIGQSISEAGRASSPLPTILAGLLPVFVGVVGWSVVVYLAGRLFGLSDWSFEACLRLMLYAVVGMAVVMVGAEEAFKLAGRDPNALLPLTMPVGGLFLAQFAFRARRDLSRPRHAAASLLIGALTACLGLVL